MDCATCRRNCTPSSRSSTGIRSSAEWIEPRGDLGRHRPQREEPVRDRPERLAQPVRVGEPGDADRRQPRARLELRRRTPRSPTRAACRARSASRPGRRATRARSRPRRATAAARASASASVCPGRSRQSTVTSQRPGMTFRFARRLDHRRRDRQAEQRLDHLRRDRIDRRAPRRAPRSADGTAVDQRREEPLRLGRQHRLGRELAEPLDVAAPP